jgi:hypothetical protein
MPAAAIHNPAPDTRELLPSLLACLTAANTSKDLPPALLPILSPILRQRVQLLASDNWLTLLCWDREVAARLPDIVGKIQVEPHPASGEIEVDEPDHILYRRSDPETLHAKLVLGEFGILPVYLWCTGGEGGDGWRLAELRGIQDTDDGTQWFSNMSEANDAGLCRTTKPTNGFTDRIPAPAASRREPTPQNEDDDDAYWAAYDQTPGQTPARTPVKRSPAPMTNSRAQVGPTQSELEYFARYASEVQPALDAHDPDETTPGPGESTLNGDSLFQHEPQTETLDATEARSYGMNDDRHDSAGDDKAEHIEKIDDDRYAALNHPRPSSSASSKSVEKLEREAENHSQAELAIKQHISTDMKSLFRLARASGITREEFERIVHRELEVLPMLEQDN